MHKPYLFASLLMLAALGVLPACEGPQPLPIQSRFEAGCVFQADECFTDQPLRIRVIADHPRSDVEYTISFGDGSGAIAKIVTGTNATAYQDHRYELPGVYRIEIEGPGYMKDTTIIFQAAPKRIRSRVITIGRKFIWQGSSGEYFLIHNTTKFPQPDFGYDRWIVTKVTASFDSIGSSAPFDDMKGSATNFAVLPSGNFVQVRDGAIEQFDPTGKMLSHVELNIQKIKYLQRSIGVVDGQLKITSDSRFDILLTTTDLQGAIIDTKTIQKPAETVQTGISTFGPDGEFSTFYYKNPYDPTKVFLYGYDGEVKTTADDFSIGAEVFTVDDGFVMLARGSDNFGGIVKWGMDGQLRWRADIHFDISEDPMAVFSSNGDTWIFFGQMEGARISATGQIVWRKKFATMRDNFNTAMMNNAGNFVIVGTRHCDFLQPDKFPCLVNSFSEYRLSDRIFVEVDKDGNIVDH